MAMTSLWLSDQVDKPLPPNPLDATNRPADVVVVGAGITGLVTAVLLAPAGRDVLVPDAHTAGADANVNNSSKAAPGPQAVEDCRQGQDADVRVQRPRNLTVAQ